MELFYGNVLADGMLLPLVVVTLAMLIPIVAIITEHFQKKAKMRLIEKAIEHGANLDDLNLDESGEPRKRDMPFRGGMVTVATGVAILLAGKVYIVADGELNNLMMIGGVIVLCVGVALLVNDFMNRDRFRQE